MVVDVVLPAVLGLVLVGEAGVEACERVGKTWVSVCVSSSFLLSLAFASWFRARAVAYARVEILGCFETYRLWWLLVWSFF